VGGHWGGREGENWKRVQERVAHRLHALRGTLQQEEGEGKVNKKKKGRSKEERVKMQGTDKEFLGETAR